MSSAQVDRTSKVHHHVGKKENEKARKMFNQSRHFKFNRKRSQSFTGGNTNKFFPPYKRRKKEGGIIPPTKFLLGGNICDPLNLNSMQDEEINRAMNAVTPKSSPLPTPKHRKGTIEVIIPPNINDPLNLSNCNDDEYEKQLISPTKKFSKRRNRKRKRASSGSGKEDVSHSGSETTELKSDELTLLKSSNPKATVTISSSSSSEASTESTTPVITPTLAEVPSMVALAMSLASAVPDEESTEITTAEEEFAEPAVPTLSLAATLPASPVAAITAPLQLIKEEKDTKISQLQQANDIAVNQVQQLKDGKESKETKVETQSPQKDKNKLRLKGLDIEPKDKRLRKVDIKDKIVSPVIPQPGAWKARPAHRPNQKKSSQTGLVMPNFKPKNSRYQYGNYDRYYGYRNPHLEIDPRLKVFAQRKELFYNKDILDIGCNIGHITLSVARDLAARSVTGIDIDRKLIGIARSNIKHYVNCVRSPVGNDDDGGTSNYCDLSFFPMSMPITYGPIDVPGFTKNNNDKGFPYNVTFVQGNYIFEDDSLLKSEQPQFDTILCLSITKWIHLNHGDAGLKQAFKRMHAQLRPGGVLVLEAQNWPSYGKKKGLTERIYRNYHSIEFFPQKFTQYLISPEVGFTQCEVVSIPPHPSKGFQRPIQLFKKAGTSPTSRAISAPSTSTMTRFVARAQEKKESEIRAFERDLFPIHKSPANKLSGNLSNLSQRSSESMSSHYEQLENVYAPSSTPCYDTPSHNENSQSAFEPEKMCYVDVSINSSNKPDDGLIVQPQTVATTSADCDDATKHTETVKFNDVDAKTEDYRKRKSNEINYQPDIKKKKKITDDSDNDDDEERQINITPKQNYNIDNKKNVQVNQQLETQSPLKDSSNTPDSVTNNT